MSRTVVVAALSFAAVSFSACTTYAPPVGPPPGAARAQVGGVLITEVMIDPDFCDDAGAEWFEVVNLTDDEVDLSELAVINAAGQRSPLRAEQALRPGETTFVGRGTWDSFCVGQRHPGVWFDGDLELSNTGEQLTLVDRDEHVLDRTPWFDAERIVAGSSLSLRPDAHDADGNDAASAWYLGEECLDTAGNSPGAPNAACLAELDWMGLSCDDDGCDVGDDWDLTEHLRTAHAWAAGVADERVDIERQGLFFHSARWTVPGGVDPEDWRASEAQWEITFVTEGDDLWGYELLYVVIDLNAGTVELEERYGNGLAWVELDETDGIAVTAQSVVDAVDRSWSWWGDVGSGYLNRARYEDTLRWTIVDSDGDDRWAYDATTGERTEW
jgi:hypothetical protein